MSSLLNCSTVPAAGHGNSMVRRSITLRMSLFLALVLAVASPAFGQSSLSFSYTLADGNVHALAAGTTITFPSVDVGRSTTAAILINNSGTGPGTIVSLSATGTGFTLSNPNLLPATVLPGQNLAFGIVFAPPQPGSFTGAFQIGVPGGVLSGNLAGATPPANFSLEYVDPTTGNVVTLSSSSNLQFLNTQVGGSSTISMLVANTGSGSGFVSAVSLAGGTGSAFQIVSLLSVPVLVGPGQQLGFGVRFSPSAQLQYTDTLSVTANGQTFVTNLQGQGVQPIYSYQFVSSAGTTTASAGGTVSLPDTTVGQTTNAAVTVTNTGLGAGQVAIINVTAGQGFSVGSLPATFPVTLQPGGTLQFTLTFVPTQPGPVTGRLTFGGDTITIDARGVGPQLTYTYTSGSAVVPVTANGSVIFTPLAVGSTESLNFTVQNAGNTSATISSINLAAPSTIFALSGLPGLPATLDPNGTITFPISFSPNNTGNLSATLLVNGASFTVSGNGTSPPALPAYSFTGASATAQPDQQPAIGLTLANPYPLPLQGTLTMAFNSSVFAGDSSIQFANGGTTVKFTIPANSTQALFSGNATSVSLQTGTTSGSIVITPSFSLQDGFSVTPPSPAILTMAIPGLAPQLLNGSISVASASSFTLTLSGFTTTRVLSQLNIAFTAQSGQAFNPSQLTLDVSSSSAAWFQGSAATGFGGSFLVAVPFTLSGGGSAANLVSYLKSLSITATNNVGTSSALVVTVP